MLTGKWPLTEATLYAKAMRRGNQSDTNDLGITNLSTVEPGLGMDYIFDYSISATNAPFDPVVASRFGWAFNMPLRTAYTVRVLAKRPIVSSTLINLTFRSSRLKPKDPHQTLEW